MSKYNYAAQDRDGEVTLRVFKPELPRSGVSFWSRLNKHSDYEIVYVSQGDKVNDWKSRVVDLKTHDYRIVDGVLIAVAKGDRRMGHIHAGKMEQYAKDATKYDKPWELWQYKCEGDSEFNNCATHPQWQPTHTYNRLPETININGYKVPKPLTVAPKYGTYYYALCFGIGEPYQKFLWNNAEFDKILLADGLVHDNAEAAELHTKAILSFTKGLS